MIPYTVSIGDFVADNHDDDDFRITAKLSGWGAAPIRLDVQDKSQQDGAWDAQPHRSSRVITIEGEVDQPSHAAAMAVSDALCAIPLVPQQLVVDSEVLGPRSATVRLEVGADPVWFTPTYFRYALQLRAVDPLRYGPATFDAVGLSGAIPGTGRVWPRAWPRDWGVAEGETPGSVAVRNAGTSSYLPRLRIDGPVTNPVVTLAETGDRIAYTGTVTEGQWLDIDCGRRRVLLNGQVSRRERVSFVGAWLAVPVGGGTLTWTADDADPAATLSVWGFEGAYT